MRFLLGFAAAALFVGSVTAKPWLSAGNGVSPAITNPFNEQGQQATTPIPTVRMTNAERLRNGLPLLPPTRRAPNLAPRQSGIPPSTGPTGRLLVRNEDAKDGDPEYLGYVGKELFQFLPSDPDTGRWATLVSSIDDALIVQLGSTAPGLTTLLSVNGLGPFSSLPYLGAGTDVGSQYFATDGAASLTATEYTPPGSPPTPAKHAYISWGVAEAGIWSLNSMTGELTAHWTDPDGTLTFPDLVYSPQVDHHHFTLVTDSDEWKVRHPRELAIRVTLVLV